MDNITTTNSTLDQYPDYVGETFDPHRFLSQPWVVVALILSSIAILANLLSICAVARVRPHLTPHFRLILNLALSDILVGVSAMAHFFNQAINHLDMGDPPDVLNRNICTYLVIKALNNTGLNITLLNLFGMAIDHYFAILRPLHHPLLMSKSRANLMIVTLWFIAIVTGFSGFLTKLHKVSSDNYCRSVFWSHYQEEYTVFFITLVSLFLMCFIYIRIYFQVRRRQAEMSRRGRHSGITRNKRALITTLLILGSFAACWLPNCLFQISMLTHLTIHPEAIHKLAYSLDVADRFLYNIMLLNSICDPIIYTMRMCEVQHGYRKLFQPCLGQRRMPIQNNTSMYSFSSSFKWMAKKPSTNYENTEVMDRLTWSSTQFNEAVSARIKRSPSSSSTTTTTAATTRTGDGSTVPLTTPKIAILID